MPSRQVSHKRSLQRVANSPCRSAKMAALQPGIPLYSNPGIFKPP